MIACGRMGLLPTYGQLLDSRTVRWFTFRMRVFLSLNRDDQEEIQCILPAGFLGPCALFK